MRTTVISVESCGMQRDVSVNRMFDVKKCPSWQRSLAPEAVTKRKVKVREDVTELHRKPPAMFVLVPHESLVISSIL